VGIKSEPVAYLLGTILPAGEECPTCRGRARGLMCNTTLTSYRFFIRQPHSLSLTAKE